MTCISVMPYLKLHWLRDKREADREMKINKSWSRVRKKSVKWSSLDKQKEDIHEYAKKMAKYYTLRLRKSISVT